MALLLPRGARAAARLAPLTALALAAAPGPAGACSVCGCGDPMLAASDPAAVSGRLRVGLDGEYLTVRSGAPEDVLDQHTLRLSAVWSPWEGLSLLGQLPWTRKDLRNADGTGSLLSGPGDAEVGARLTVLDRVSLGAARRQSLALSAGSSLPTGGRTLLQQGQPVDEHGQLGTGAFGPHAGLHLRWEERTVTLLASLSGRLRTTNAEGYRYGDALLWSVHGQWWPLETLQLDLGLDGRAAAADQAGGAAVEDTGGAVLAAAPGVSWTPGGGLWLGARAQLPFASWLDGAQSVGPTVVVSLQYLVR